MLLSRDKFRESVFDRDGHKCVICGQPAVDAHHILERRLWSDSGYYLDNGASVCEQHHLEAEMTIISVEQLREACGILKPVIPSHFYDDSVYDKWGNQILPNGMRLRGELFHDESVQKILGLGGVLNLFTCQVKYPRTHHLPWSPGVNDDDRVISSMDAFIGKRVIATEKKDGENTSMYRDYIHARSLDSNNHISRNWVKNMWARIAYEIPQDWRICGENLYAEHSIPYNDLPSYFLGFSIWNEKNICLSWDETCDYFELLGIKKVPVLYDGIYDEAVIKSLWNDKDWGLKEGYVLRVADEFKFSEFRFKVAKFVRKGHIQTTKHWMHGQQMKVNGLTS